jgi:hypothetical protein
MLNVVYSPNAEGAEEQQVYLIDREMASHGIQADNE